MHRFAHLPQGARADRRWRSDGSDSARDGDYQKRAGVKRSATFVQQTPGLMVLPKTRILSASERKKSGSFGIPQTPASAAAFCAHRGAQASTFNVNQPYTFVFSLFG